MGGTLIEIEEEEEEVLVGTEGEVTDGQLREEVRDFIFMRRFSCFYLFWHIILSVDNNLLFHLD